jgi:Peptidase C13 family
VDEAPPPTGAPGSDAPSPPGTSTLNAPPPVPSPAADASRARLPSDVPGPVTRRRALLRNLAAGFELLLPWRRVPPARFVGGFDQIVPLLALTLLIWTGLDRLHAEVGAVLQWDGLFGWATYLILGLFSAALIARVQSPDTDTRSLLVPSLSVAPYLLLLFSLLGAVPMVGASSIAALVAWAYLILIGLRVVKAAFGTTRIKVALLTIALILAAPFVIESFGLDTRLWVTEETQQDQDEDTADAEGLFYDQPARIAAEVDRVSQPTLNGPNVFFLGFAGVGAQGVFRREALFAQQVFADRFGSGDRSVELINDEEDRDSYPLATVSGLDQAVRLLAAKMNTDEDILVLLLTSHGSEDGLAVANGSLPMRQLAPADLQQVLDTSGIKWRIVIVSACYSGIFLEPLKNETTLIVTAADAKHTSFGCDDSRDLTWFGEAFLRDSLPHAPSFEAAFSQAAALIKSRETAEHQIHSNPQFYLGGLMRDKLATLRPGAATPIPRRSSGTRTVSHSLPAPAHPAL